MIGSGFVDITLYNFDLGLDLENLVGEEPCAATEEFESQRQAA